MNKGSDAIIFSRGRPWQLGQLIQSAIKFCDFNRFYIIYKKETEYQTNYRDIENKFGKKVCFINENKKIWKTFCSTILECGDFISIMADDLVFFDKFSSLDASNLMRKNNVLSYHFKLNIKYDYCYSFSKKQIVPSNTIESESSFIWEENDGNWDWFYPFDLTGSMYSKKDLKYLTNKASSNILKSKDISNPNDIEMYISKIIFAKGMNITGKNRMACPKIRNCASIPINHVGSFSFTPNIKSDLESIQYVNNNIFGKFDYNLEFFKNYDQRSVQIPDFKLIEISQN